MKLLTKEEEAEHYKYEETPPLLPLPARGSDVMRALD